MNIRTRLTLQFLLMGGVIMITASVAIYFFSAGFSRDDFYNRLENKANVTARLLIEVEEIDVGLLKKIDTDSPTNLPEEKIIILDYKNDTLYSSDIKKEIFIYSDLANRIRLQGKIKYKQGRYEVLGLLYTGLYDRFVVFAAAVDTDGLEKLRNLRLILLVVCLTSFIILSIAGWFFAGRALEPISGVVKQVEDISITSLDLRVNEGNGTDELARLARTFNKMLDRLEFAFRMQKDFISNASHELRTPLTSINGQLEVLLIKDRTTEEYKSAVSSVLEDIKKMTDLSNRLLLLAYTASEKQNLNNQLLRVDEIMWQAKEELQKFHPDYTINISMDSSVTDSDQMIISGDEFLIKTAFSNLIDNACKYSVNHTAEIDLEYYENWLIISFADKGVGIPQEDIDNILEPFHRGSNVSMIPGHGIGLSLVVRIVKSYDGLINISSDIARGTTVTIKLPVG